MSIFIGNSLNFKLQIIFNNGLVQNEGEVEITRQEFNGQTFQGTGYQRVLINENYGKEGAFGLGFNGETTSVQVDAFPFALPLYRFDFSFILDNQRLKELYELFLRLYNFRAQGQNAYILMSDDRLYVSEPIDLIHARMGTLIGTPTELNDQVNLNYFLKQVEYIISWENFEWDHFVGDLYVINMLGVEVEVISDRNFGNSSFPGLDEVVGEFEGFTITEISIPSNLPNNQDTLAFGVGYKYPEDRYFGHFSFDGDHVFISWDAAAPATDGDVRVDFNDANFSTFLLDSGPENTYIANDRIPFLVFDPEGYNLHVREFRPFNTNTFSNFRETNTLPLLYHGIRTSTESWQQPIPFNNGTYILPAQLRDPANTLTNPVNGGLIEAWEWGATDSQFRPTVGEFITEELNTTAFLTGVARVEDNEQAGLPTLFPTKRIFAINLCPSGTSNRDGGFWYGYKLNVGTNTSLTASFEFRIIGTETGIQGEGFAFVIQDDPRGVTARGGSGANLGFGGWTGSTYLSSVAITPSIAIVFDIYGNGANFNEPNIGDSTPHRVKVIKDGRTEAPIFEYDTGFDLKNTSYMCDIVIDGTADTLSITLEPTAGGVPETQVLSSFNLGLELGSSSAYIGFTAGSGSGIPVASSNHYIDRFQFNHNSTFQIPSGELSSEAYVLAATDAPLPNRNRTDFGKQILPSPFNSYEGEIISVNSTSEGDDIFYHIIRDPLQPNNTSIYKTVGIDYTSPSRVLINSVTDGSIPSFTRAINSPQNIRKFYLTQGADGGNVYSTEDFFTFVALGSWGELDIAIQNEGQLYKFRERYLIRSPNRSVLDTFTDSFIDLETLLCPTFVGSPEALAIFDSSREIISIYPTPQDDTDYRDNNVEQLVITSRDSTTLEAVRVFAMFATELCPI